MRTVRSPLALVLAALVIGAAACGSSAPEAIDDPRPTTTTTTSPAAGAGGDDEVVWQEFTSGGFVPMEYSLGTVPDVTIYADGRILRSVPDEDGMLRPVALEEATVPAAELTAFLRDAADSGLFEPGTDFGQPGVTDMPSTSVVLRSDGSPRPVDVYALDFDIDPSMGDVTAEQVERRDRLKELVAKARSLAEDPKPYVPAQVRAYLVTTGAQIDAGAAPKDWPGPSLAAFPTPAADGPGTACLVIEGPDAAAVTAAAADNPGAFWTLDGEVHQIVTAPLIPGQEGCPPS